MNGSHKVVGPGFSAFGPAIFGTPLGGRLDDESPPSSSSVSPQPALNELESEYAASHIDQAESGCAPASQLSRIYARRLVEALGPKDQPSDAYFDKDGNAVLEWHPGPGVAAAVVIGARGELRYASSRFGTSTYGSDFLTGAIPTEVLQAIRRGGRK